MKLLIDTNILIPAEPVSTADLSALSPASLRLQNLANQARAGLYVHPAQRADIASDKDPTRRSLRLQTFSRYAELINPPPIRTELTALIGVAAPGSHDDVDDQLLAAAHGRAVNYLVTEDREIHRKAYRAGISRFVVFLGDAIAILKALFDRAPAAPPAVDALPAYNLDERDPIFDSFRADYPAFDSWLEKCKTENRQAWLIQGAASYAAVAIVNPEIHPPEGLTGKVLKICSFKVSGQAYGRRYGELLLKTVFEHAWANHYDRLFVTMFDKQEQLRQLFAAFGFEPLITRTLRGELILEKPVMPEKNTQLAGLKFNVRFGPRNVDWCQPAFVIPIRPHWHEMLFPEQRPQTTLFAGAQPFGNALRKAYLCRSPITRIGEGSVIWFYRSRVDRGVVACGVAEEWLRSGHPDFVAQYVGRRTVYSFSEIERMCRQGPVLSILFRQALLLDSPIRLGELMAGRVLRDAPQSIVSLGTQEAQWLANRTH